MRRSWALPLVPLWWAGVGLKEVLFDWGVWKARRLGWPVVSVGSLSAGGAGKTPVVMMLAELLERHGVDVDVLSRGYGRGSGVVEEVDAAGSADEFGDEPMEMARAGLRVWVGADRFEAGGMADGQREYAEFAKERMQGSRRKAVHLLDDGFQHRRLGRELNVVLLTVEDVRDWLLPAGNLREPLAALRRADVVVVREEEEAELRGVIAAKTRAEVWVVRRELVLATEMPKRPVVFCGIARPDQFLEMLRGSGVEAVGNVVRRDHHGWTAEDVRALVDAGRQAGADGFVTTGKDAVKFSAEWRRELEAVGPVVVAGLRVRLMDEEGALRRLKLVWTSEFPPQSR